MMIIADFHFCDKKKKLVLSENTTLDELHQEICSRFESLNDPNNIQLRETNIMDTDINYETFAMTKEILMSASAEIMPSFIITKKENSPSPSPSPLPLPYSQRVNASNIISQPFHNNNNNNNNNIIYNAEPVDLLMMNIDDKKEAAPINIANAQQKMKLELKHQFRAGPLLPSKPKKLFNFIRNNKSFLPDDKSIDNDTLNSIINNVIKWWFEHGRKQMVLGDDIDDNNNNIIDKKEKEMNDIDLMLKNLGLNTIKTRDYQQALFEAAKKQNIICFMPTGSGKTRIAIKFIEYRLQLLYRNRLNHLNNDNKDGIQDGMQAKYIKKYIIFLVCTTHLAEQQKNAIKKAIPFIKIRKIVGSNNPDTWNKMDWQNELNYYDVFVMMHDCLKAALSHGYITMNNIDTLILDECHHVIGSKSNQSHPYSVIMEKYHQYKKSQQVLPRIMGLTASPIKTKALLSSKIIQKARELQQMMDAKLMRVEDDGLQNVISNPMLIKYNYIPYETDKKLEYPDVPKVFIDKIKKYSNMVSRLDVVIQEMGVYGAAVAMRLINDRLKERDSKYLARNPFSSKDSEKIKEKAQALELFKDYLQKNVQHFDSNLHCNQYSDSEWKFDADISMKLSLLIKFIGDSHSGIEPQIIGEDDEKLLFEEEGYNPELTASFAGKDNVNQQGIIFVKERIVAHVLQSILSTRFGNIEFGVLTGHNCRLWGLSDKQQCRIIHRFKNGSIRYLIATSVAEEGIDIQACNCVIMYHFPDTIKSYIQARGRARKQSSKYVLLINTDNIEEQQRADSFDQHEKSMIEQANNDNNDNNMDDVDYGRYEYLVPETQAFASTVNAVSMLQRYMDHLQIRKTDIERICFDDNMGYTYMISIDSAKWKLKQTEFECNGRTKRDAERRCAVNIIAALRDNELWDSNLVPVEILRKNKETQMIQKQRALFQSVDIKQLNTPSVIKQDFQCQNEMKCDDDDDLDIDMNMNDDDKIGYLYHMMIDNDPNSFPMGIILPNRIPDAFLKFIKFPVQIRKRNIETMCKEVRDYSMLIHEELHKLENLKQDNNEDDMEDMEEMKEMEELEEKAEQPMMETDGNYNMQHAIKQKKDKAVINLNKEQNIKSCYMKTTVSLHANKNNVIPLSSERFAQLMDYHKLAFKLLDRGGSKKKKKLQHITEMNEDEKKQQKDKPKPEEKEEKEENERFYLICPLKWRENGHRMKDYMIDWKCIDNIVNLQKQYEQNEPNGSLYCNKNKSNIEYELIQTRNEDGTHQNLYVSYGIHELFSSKSQIPISGQIIADYISEESRINKILHSHLQLDKNNNNNNDIDDDDEDALDEIDINAQNTQLNKLKILSVAENYKQLMLSTKFPGQEEENMNNNQDDRVIVARRYCPKIRNVLIQTRKKSKNSKSKMKQSVMFIPLQYVFATGISTSHWYQLLNIPSIIWRLENYFNILDIQKRFKSMCDIQINTDLLFEALCNAQSGTDKTYEKLECLGDCVLKFLVVLQGVLTMPNANQGYLTIWKSNIVSNANLDVVSISINLPSYGVFTQYMFELWNPSYFKQRDNNASESMYKNIKISLKLPADIIESTIGALWCTLNDKANHNLNDKCLSMAINSSRILLRKYNLLNTDFKINEKFKQLISDWDDNKFEHIFSKIVFQEKLKELMDIIEDDCSYRLTPQYALVTASCIELIDKSYQYHHHAVFADYGITYQRLEFLGDAILDIICTQFLYNHKSFRSDLSIEGQITALRSKIVGNDALGFNLQDSSLDGCIIWDGQQIDDIDHYKQEIEKLRKQHDPNQDMEDFWYLKDSNIKCPKCLGDAFEVLLAIIFIDSNYNNLFVNHNDDDDVNVDEMNLDYTLKECIQFVCGFHDYAEKHWEDKVIEL